MHTLADTFSHDGFTAYFNRTVNGLGNNKNQWLGHYNGEEAGRFQKYLFRVGHASFGSRPDYPFLRKQRAIDAAKVIFDLIPDYEDSICLYRSSWDTVDYLLENQFGNSGTEGQRAEAAFRMIGNKFPNGANQRYFGVHKMGSANDL